MSPADVDARTPATRLAETGMVAFERNRGFRVVLPGPRKLSATIAVRFALEVRAVARAAVRATDTDGLSG